MLGVIVDVLFENFFLFLLGHGLLAGVLEGLGLDGIPSAWGLGLLPLELLLLPEALDVLELLLLLAGLLILQGLDADLLHLELHPPQLQDIVLSEFVVEFFVVLLEAANDEEHAFDGLRGDLVQVLGARQGHVIRLVLRDQVVVLWHLRRFEEVPI